MRAMPHTEVRVRLVHEDPHALARVVAGLHAGGVVITRLVYDAGRLSITVDDHALGRVERRLSRMVSVLGPDQ